MSKKTAAFPLSIFNQIPHWAWISILYLVIHLPMLLALPIFADEAIYIHWSQLIIDDASRFGFFSMADGKPPFFMWLLSLTLRLGNDPLFLARLTSVAVGLATVHVMGALARVISGNKRVILITQLITIFAPFWWFYHRMALMDGLLTLFIALSFYYGVRIAIRCQRETAFAYDTIPYILLLGLSFGGAMLTKTPALFAIPVLAMTPLFALVKRQEQNRSVFERLIESCILIGIGGFIGCVFFLFLRVSPFFGSLFARSSDFTFTMKEVLNGEWKFVLFSSLPREFVWISMYMTYAVVVSSMLGFFSRSTRKVTVFLFLASLLFAAPLVAFGRVLYPRYFLPVAPFLTLSAAIGLNTLCTKKGRWIALLFVVVFFFESTRFIVPGLMQTESIPFTAIDRMQYEEEWSAGFGNNEVRDYVRQRYSQIGTKKRIIVLTEGAFGTLPDGLSIYFFGMNQLNGVEIHGIGVGPNQIPKEYTSLLSQAEVYYVVNAHRFRIADPTTLEKVFTVPRPNNAPSLLFFRVLK